jgi:hypothetical protein
MPSDLFKKIIRDIDSSNVVYFQQRKNAVGQLGLSCLQKCTAALRILAYGVAADLTDEYCRIGESTAIESLYKFCDVVITLYGDYYLRSPTEDDVKRILDENEKRGFPGLLGSLDCTHWSWKNCPRAYQGQFQGKNGISTIALEAVASYDLWIWHGFFGTPGSCNDLNILDRSPLLAKLLNGEILKCRYTSNDKDREDPYWLVDGIYPEWSCFVKTISTPQTSKMKLFAQMQESVRKDVERAFGVLKSRFQILGTPSKVWSLERMATIIKTCIILHNMIVERRSQDAIPDAILVNENQNLENDGLNEGGVGVARRQVVIPINPPEGSIAALTANMRNIADQLKHRELKADLIEHLWNFKGNIN